jgi:hypothetical protein
MAVKYMSRVWEDSKQEGGRLLVLIAMADNANNYGFSWYGVPKIAKMARLGDRWTRQAINDLVEARELAKIQRGTGRSNAYVVMLGTTLDDWIAGLGDGLNVSPEAAREAWDLFWDGLPVAFNSDGTPVENAGQTPVENAGQTPVENAGPPEVEIRDPGSPPQPDPLRSNNKEYIDLSLDQVLDLWPQVIEEAKLQVGRGPRQWLIGSKPIAIDKPWDAGDPPVVVVEVKNTYAAQWVNSKLKEILDRILTMLLEAPAQTYARPAAVDPDFVRVTEDPQNSAKEIPANA